MKTNRKKITELMNKILISALTILVSVTSFTVDISANEEVYRNEDVMINVERKQISDNTETELLFSVKHDENVQIEDIKLGDLEVEKVDGDLPNTYKYKSVVGIDGNFKFTVNYSKTLLIETDDSQKTIERKDKFDFNVIVEPPLIDIGEQKEVVEVSEPTPVEPKQDQHLPKEEQRVEPTEVEKKTEQIDIEENKNINTEFDGKGRSIFQVNGMMRAGNISKSDIPYKYHVVKISDPSYEYYDYQYANLSVDGEHAICLDPSTMVTSSKYDPTADFDSLSKSLQKRLILIGNYGYKYFGTQKHILAETTLVWKEKGWSTKSWKDMSGNVIDISQEIADIENAISHHYDRPSWNGTTKNVNVGDVIDLSDANLKGFTVTADSNIEIVQNSGSTLKVKLKSGTSGGINLKKKSNLKDGTPIIYKSPNSQDLLVARVKDPIYADITLKANKHTVVFEKVDAVNNSIKLNGATIRVSRSNSVDANGFMNAPIHWDYTTGSNGLTTADKFGDIGKTYYYQEVKAPNGYLVDKTIRSFTAQGGITSTFTIQDKKPLGEIVIHKKDNHGNALVNVVFDIKNASNSVVGTVTTDSNGKASLKQLPLGDYTIVEKSVPSGIVLDKTVYNVSIKYKDQVTPVVIVTKNIQNKYQRTDITLTKVENNWDTTFPQNNGIVLSDAVIELYAKTNIYEGSKLIYLADTLIGTETTNANGQVTFHNLPLGDYYAKEKAAPNGYVLFNGQWDISVKYDGSNPSVEIIKNGKTVDNQVIYGKATLIKQDTDRKLLEGAVFGLFTKDGQKLAELTTDRNGMIVTPDLRYGDYYFKELQAPIGYILDETEIPFTVSEHQSMQYITAPNEPIQAKLLVNKYDSETLLPLAGAEFQIFSYDKNEIVTVKYQDGKNVVEKDTWITDEDGQFLIEAYLSYGRYSLIETKAPEGYNLVDPIDFEIDENQTYQTIEIIGKVLEKDVANRPIRSDVAVAKVDAVSKEYLPNFEFKAINMTTKEEFSGITDVDGIAYFTQLKYGRYMFTEFKVDGEYLIDQTPQFLDIIEDGIVYELTFENYKPTGDIEVIKVDYKDGSPVADATYGLFDLNGDVVTEVKTNEKGIAKFSDIALGDYVLKETVSPKGYLIDETEYPVSIQYVDEKTPVIYVKQNVVEMREVELKTSASFTEREKDEPNIVTITDKVAYENLIIGKEYRVDGYLMDKETNQPILIDGQRIEGSTTFTAEKHDGTIDVLFTFDQNKLSTKSIVVFEDMYEEGQLIAVHNDINDIDQTVDLITVRITKLDSVSKKSLKGAEFTMYDTEDMVIDVQVSDDSGIAEFTIFAGEVVRIKETNAPEGYILSDEVIEIDASKDIDGNLYSVEYFNDMLPVVVLPKAGVGMSGSLSFGGLSALLGAISLLISKLKKKKETEEHLIETVSSIKRDGDVITIVDTQEVCYFKEGIEHITSDVYSVAFDYYGRAIKLVCANKELIHYLLEVLKM